MEGGYKQRTHIIPCVQKRKRSPCLIGRKTKTSYHSWAETGADVTRTPLWTHLCSWVLLFSIKMNWGDKSAEQSIDRVSHNERKACSQRVRKDNENRRDHGWTDYSKCVEGRMARDRWSISLLSRQTISKISRTDGFSWGVLSWTRVWQACLIWPLPEGAMFCFFCLSESLPLYNNPARFMVSETRLSYHELMKSSGWPFSSQASGPTPMAMK